MNLSENPTNEEYRETLDVVQKQLKRMTKLVNDLFTMCALNEYEMEEAVSVGSLIAETAAEHTAAAEQKHIQIEISVENCTLKGNLIKTDSGYSLNTAYVEDNLVDLSGEEFKYDDDTCYLSKSAGIGVCIKDKKILDMINNATIGASILAVTDDDEYGFVFYFTSQKAIDLYSSITEDTTDEEFDEICDEADKGTFSYVQVMSVPNDKDDENGQQMKLLMDEDFANVETIGKIGDSTYYFAYNTDYSSVDATDEEKENLKYMVEQIDSLKNSICIFPAEKSKSSENSVETICTDADQEMELAQTILDKNNCKFITIIPDDVLTENLLSNVSGVPATFFVDSEGDVIGEPLTGNRTKDAYLKALSERAESVNSEVNPVK